MNRLYTEKSAYLRHAAEQLIDWYPWGDEAFRRAVAEDKPVFLSSGQPCGALLEDGAQVPGGIPRDRPDRNPVPAIARKREGPIAAWLRRPSWRRPGCKPADPQIGCGRRELRVGAAGGVLTPSLTLGALLATAICPVLNLIFPGIPSAGFAVVGAAAFLASSMNMPLTAILLTLEFTRVSHDFCVPIFLAVAGSIATLRACTSLVPRIEPPPASFSPGFSAAAGFDRAGRQAPAG